MDTLGLLVLDALGLIGWVVGAFRPRAHLWIRIGCLPSVLWLAGYFALEIAVSRPELFAGQAEAGKITVGLMAAGVCALLSKSKPEPGARQGGGAVSA